MNYALPSSVPLITRPRRSCLYYPPPRTRSVTLLHRHPPTKRSDQLTSSPDGDRASTFADAILDISISAATRLKILARRERPPSTVARSFDYVIDRTPSSCLLTKNLNSLSVRVSFCLLFVVFAVTWLLLQCSCSCGFSMLLPVNLSPLTFRASPATPRYTI